MLYYTKFQVYVDGEMVFEDEGDLAEKEKEFKLEVDDTFNKAIEKYNEFCAQDLKGEVRVKFSLFAADGGWKEHDDYVEDSEMLSGWIDWVRFSKN